MESILHLPSVDFTYGIPGFFVGPGHTPYRGLLDDEVFFDCHSDDDGKSVYDYYLWPDRLVDSDPPTPPGNFRPPEDSFSTLYALGFQPDHSQHAKTFPRDFKTPPQHSVAVDGEESARNQKADESPLEPKAPFVEDQSRPSADKKHDLADMHWDDDLETFVPNGENE